MSESGDGGKGAATAASQEPCLTTKAIPQGLKPGLGRLTMSELELRPPRDLVAGWR